ILRFNTATQQMVAIARAIGFKARLVIMDEPTSSLDDREVAVLFDVIRGLKAEGVSVIFVSHKLDELYAVCDRVTVMRDGRTVQVSAMQDVGKLDLVTTMLGRELSQSLHAPPAPVHAGEPLLSAGHLARGRRLRDASFAVRAGEIVGLAGLLGSGRTESARIVFGVDRADSGTVQIAGSGPVSEPVQAIAAGLGFCTE